MLSIVTWLWHIPGYRTTFTGEHVNRLATMVRAHYGPVRVVCVTDTPEGIDSTVEIVPDCHDFDGLQSPHGAAYPSCYRRLRLFHPDAARWFGDRFVSLDLDVVAVADLRPLWDRADDFVGYRDPYWPAQLNGSMMLLRAGARPGVWTDFQPSESPTAARLAGFRGSDQAWISFKTRGAAAWGVADGVLSYRKHVQTAGALPDGARLVVMHGEVNPWSPEAQRLDWCRDHWGAAVS